MKVTNHCKLHGNSALRFCKFNQPKTLNCAIINQYWVVQNCILVSMVSFWCIYYIYSPQSSQLLLHSKYCRRLQLTHFVCICRQAFWQCGHIWQCPSQRQENEAPLRPCCKHLFKITISKNQCMVNGLELNSFRCSF